MGKVWKPVDTHTDIYDTPDGTIAVSVCNEQISFDFHGAMARSLEWRLNHDERLCRLVPDEGVSVQPICAKCNDYLEPPSYCETCYDTAVNAWREAEAALAQHKGGVPVEVVETVVRWSELLHALVMDLRAHNVDVANLLRTEIDVMLAWAQQQKGGE